MENYKKMYFELFNEISEIIEKLQEAQRRAEEFYLNETTEIKKTQKSNI